MIRRVENSSDSAAAETSAPIWPRSTIWSLASQKHSIRDRPLLENLNSAPYRGCHAHPPAA